jgi:hypothetical protein
MPTLRKEAIGEPSADSAVILAVDAQSEALCGATEMILVPFGVAAAFSGSAP